MFSRACPSCGASVSFRSATSAMAVCEYCRCTLLRDADVVRDGGRMAPVLEDYSPIRITTSGVYAGKAFGVVGRIQLRYDAGFWNEWYILFDDGSAGWLSDASGQYAITVDAGVAPDAPAFERIVPGGACRHEGETYTAADRRQARCTGGEGELPFRVGAGWEAKVVDYRLGFRFLTLDYSDGSPPRRYAGKRVSLADIKAQLLRGADEIRGSAGRLPGGVSSLACPSCGTAITWRPGLATHLHCPSCGTESDASAGVAEVIRAARDRESLSTTLSLGERATVEGRSWLLIGLMERQEVGGREVWVEYLLFHEDAGFMWLVESATGWCQARVCDEWPEEVSGSGLRCGGKHYTRLTSYGAEVTHVAGAFNWRVSLGDKCSVTDYRSGRQTLSSERSAAEITWSLATPVPAGNVDQWFGKGGTLREPAEGAVADADGAPQVTLRPLALGFSALVALLNAPLMLAGGLYCWLTTLLAIGILWLPLFTRLFEDD